ncbi:hypothetical protein SBC2_31050 [Caballeronia sp. SBC2]|nr:hypothetical protein SBC2_31050 [Caballeronia sp. SBC2]
MTGMEAFPEIGTALRLCCGAFQESVRASFYVALMQHNARLIGLKRARHPLNIA